MEPHTRKSLVQCAAWGVPARSGRARLTWCPGGACCSRSSTPTLPPPASRCNNPGVPSHRPRAPRPGRQRSECSGRLELRLEEGESLENRGAEGGQGVMVPLGEEGEEEDHGGFARTSAAARAVARFQTCTDRALDCPR